MGVAQAHIYWIHACSRKGIRIKKPATLLPVFLYPYYCRFGVVQLIQRARSTLKLPSVRTTLVFPFPLPIRNLSTNALSSACCEDGKAQCWCPPTCETPMRSAIPSADQISRAATDAV